MNNDLDLKWHRLLFGVRRSIRYHQKRMAFYARFNTIINILVLVFGSTTFAVLLAKLQNTVSMYCSLIVTIVATADLVIGTTKKSIIHEALKRRFLFLEQELVNSEFSKTEQKYVKFFKERLLIESEEPPPLRVLDIICHNELMKAMGYSNSELAKVLWYQRLFAHFFDIAPHKIE